MTTVNFVLLREGTSDEALVSHLGTLLVRAGCSEAAGTCRPYKPPVGSQLALLEEEEGAPVDVVFVHRDSDSRDPAPRVQEIQVASANTEWGKSRVVPIVPIQATEAWLLVDESAIRSVVGRPSGKADLGLPKVRNVENEADPKATLKAALLAASEATGRRLKQEHRMFTTRRRTLLERLDIDGPVTSLKSWGALVDAIDRCAAEHFTVSTRARWRSPGSTSLGC